MQYLSICVSLISLSFYPSVSPMLSQMSQDFSWSFPPLPIHHQSPNEIPSLENGFQEPLVKFPTYHLHIHWNTHLAVGWSLNQNWRGNKTPCGLRSNALHCHLAVYNRVKGFLLSKTKVLLAVDTFLLFCSAHFPFLPSQHIWLPFESPGN